MLTSSENILLTFDQLYGVLTKIFSDRNKRQDWKTSTVFETSASSLNETEIIYQSYIYHGKIIL